jgi:hypothetical protein
LRQRAAPHATPAPFESDVRYFSQRVWSNCGGCQEHRSFLTHCAHCDVFPGWGEFWDNPQTPMTLPPVLSNYKTIVEQFSVRHRPRRTLEWSPVLIECRLEVCYTRDDRMRTVSITCDAIYATILSLFETPQTALTLPQIEIATGIPAVVLSLYMKELCARHAKEGLVTGVLKVSRRCVTALHFYKLTPLILRRETKQRHINSTQGEHCMCNTFCPGHMPLHPCFLPPTNACTQFRFQASPRQRGGEVTLSKIFSIPVNTCFERARAPAAT